MRISREKAKANKAEVVAQASRLFRERGLDGPSVTDVMRAAGLTHGGFYNHFSSKSDLQASALTHNFDAAVARLAAIAQRPAPAAGHIIDQEPDAGTSADALHAYISNYLSPRARDARGAACPMVAFGADVSREDSDVRLAYAEGLERYLTDLARLIANREPLADGPAGITSERGASEEAASGGAARDEIAMQGEAGRSQAIALLSTLVGGLSLARSVAADNPALSDELLDAARLQALQLASFLSPA